MKSSWLRLRRLRIHAGVIGANRALRKLLLKQGCQLLGQPPGGAVDDAAARLLREPVQQGRILLGFGVQAAAGIGQVGTIEAGDVHLRSCAAQACERCRCERWAWPSRSGPSSWENPAARALRPDACIPGGNRVPRSSGSELRPPPAGSDEAAAAAAETTAPRIARERDRAIRRNPA